MLTSKIPDQMKIRSLKPSDLVEAGIVSRRIAYEIYKGSTKLRLSTLAELCRLFGVRFLDDLIEYTPDK